MSQFVRTPLGNEVLNGDGFYLSWNGAPCAAVPVFAGDTDDGETALYVAEGGKWMILNGDFREEYLEAFPRGLAACVAVYESHRATCRSSWTVDE